MKIILLCILAVAMIGLMVPSAYALEDKGDFYLIFNSPVDDSDIIKMAVNELNRSYVLQQDIPIKFEKCGYANAYWANSIKTIVMCEELVSMFHELFGKAFKDDLEIQQTFTIFATNYVLHHEIGHALVDEYNLPVIGREENFADRFAAHEMIGEYGGESLAPAIAWYLGESSYGVIEIFGVDIVMKESVYAGRHNLNEQRGYDMACLAYGALSKSGENKSMLESLKSLLDGKMSKQRCISDYQYNKYSVHSMFDQYHPEDVAKKNAYEKAKNDAIQNAKSKAEALQLDAYNTLSFIKDNRIPWINERSASLLEITQNIVTSGDEQKRIKFKMIDKINDWRIKNYEFYKVAYDAYENKEYNTSLQYSKKLLDYAYDDHDLVDSLNVESKKINNLRQEEIQQETESRYEYLIDDANYYGNLLEKKFAEVITTSDEIFDLYFEVDNLGAFDQIEDVRDSHMRLMGDFTGPESDKCEYCYDERILPDIVTMYVEDGMYSEAEALIRDAKNDLNTMNEIIKKLESHNKQTQEIISNLNNERNSETFQQMDSEPALKKETSQIFSGNIIETVKSHYVFGDKIHFSGELDRNCNCYIIKNEDDWGYEPGTYLWYQKNLRDNNMILSVNLSNPNGTPVFPSNHYIHQNIWTEVSSDAKSFKFYGTIDTKKSKWDVNYRAYPSGNYAMEIRDNGKETVTKTNFYYESFIPSESDVETIPQTQSISSSSESSSKTAEDNNSEGGGCLIATAAFGSEMAPQVQFLRELRDNTVMSTQSGTAFMTGFNQFYYSFSPQIADYERENPVFKEAVKVTLTPLLTSLTLLNYVEIDSEEEMLGYGISIILLNIGMYFVVPAILVISVKKVIFERSPK